MCIVSDAPEGGLGGVAISFCDTEEKPLLKDIEKLIEKSIPVVDDHPYLLIEEEPAVKPELPKKAASGKRNSGGYYRKKNN